MTDYHCALRQAQEPITRTIVIQVAQEPASVEKSAQQHQVVADSSASPLEPNGSESVSPQSSTTCDSSLLPVAMASPLGALANQHSFYTGGSSARVVAENRSCSRQASQEETRNIEVEQRLASPLGPLNSAREAIAHDASPSSSEQSSAEDAVVETVQVAARGVRQYHKAKSLGTASMSRGPNIWTDAEIENTLTVHYFDYVCEIMSCFDSHQNPFRKDIPRLMLTCGYINDCVNGLSAAHLANSVSGIHNIAIRHQTKAVQGLMSVIQSIQHSSRQESNANNGLLRLSTTRARHQVLLTVLLLGISAAWYDASATGMAHLHGARLLFEAWLVDEGIHESPSEPAVLDPEQQFMIGAMVYLECLVSIVVDQPVEALDHLRRFATLTHGQRVYPNPWTGISTPLFVHLARGVALIRRKRASMSQGGGRSDIALELTRSARKLYELVLAYRPPLAMLVDDTQDPKTPPIHLFAVDEMLRLVILLELTQVFPELIKNDPSSGEVRQSSLDLAIAILTIVSDLPESSGATMMHTIPLLSAGSALQAIKCAPRNIHHGYDLSAASFDALRAKITPLIYRPAVLQTWRNKVAYHVEKLYRRVALAQVKRMTAILETVWRRADQECRPSLFASGVVHWIDVMVEEKLETLFG